MQLPLLKCIDFLNELGCTQNPLLFKPRHKLLHEILRILEPAGNKQIQKEKNPAHIYLHFHARLIQLFFSVTFENVIKCINCAFYVSFIYFYRNRSGDVPHSSALEIT